jgi:inner membrane protein
VKIRFLYLTAASLIAAATHPLLDWTNNYGVRPFLPWSGRWFYGDFVFIMDPYIWLVLGGAAFLLTSNTRWKIIAWGALAALLLTIIVLVSRQRGLGGIGVTVAAAVWIAGLAGLIFAKTSNLAGRAGSSLAVAGLAILALYWGGLSLLHGLALSNTQQSAQAMAGERNESLVKTAAMPTAANPFRWQSLAETDRATYKFSVGVANSPARSVERFEKPQGWAAQLVEVANRDRRARILLEFSRFPVEQVADPNCVSRTLVQIADLRYTEPGVARGNFSTNIPVDCPAR